MSRLSTLAQVDRLIAALGVMVTDRRIRGYLALHDPKALAQADAALAPFGYRNGVKMTVPARETDGDRLADAEVDQ